MRSMNVEQKRRRAEFVEAMFALAASPRYVGRSVRADKVRAGQKIVLDGQVLQVVRVEAAPLENRITLCFGSWSEMIKRSVIVEVLQ